MERRWLEHEEPCVPKKCMLVLHCRCIVVCIQLQGKPQHYWLKHYENLLAYMICSNIGKFQDGWIQWLNSVINDLGSFHFSAQLSLVMLYAQTRSSPDYKMTEEEERFSFFFCLDICLFNQWRKPFLGTNPHPDSPSCLSGRNCITYPILNHSLARGMQPPWLA